MKTDGRTKHGGHRTKLYQVWSMMKSRCNNPNHPEWIYWGQKGIQVCPEWETFPPFKAWAISSGYREGLLLDRKENSLDYSPENCKWSTPHESAVNRGTTKMTVEKVIEMRRRAAAGEMQKNLAVDFGMKPNTVSGIVNRKFWRDV